MNTLKSNNLNFVNGTTSIYGMVDPITNEIMYIGNTKNYLPDRKKVHIYQSKNAVNPSKKEKWILELLNLGLKPVMILLETVNDDIRYDREKELIKLYSKINELVNSSPGGKIGSTGTVRSEKYKKYLSEKMKGNKISKGENHPKCKLSDLDVLSIRKEYNEGLNAFILSEKYNVTYNHIRLIIRNKMRIL